MLPLRILLARNLGLARRKADELLASAKETDPSLPDSVDPTHLPFTLSLLEGDVVLHDEFHLILNKPTGCVTALEDARHPTVMSYLRDAPLAPELRPVGRLDLDTTGLLIFTTSGDYLHALTHPRMAIARTYHAALARPYGPYSPGMALRDGLVPSILNLAPLPSSEVHPALVAHPEAQCHASITITGGAYHEVRRIFAALGSHVLSLCRVSFGPFVLPPNLAYGEFQALPSAEIKQAIAAAKSAVKQAKNKA